MTQAGDSVGHIRLQETIGEGGMGTVWAGFHEKLRREVAVKTVRGDRCGLEARARFLTEARILSRLEHPNVCRVYDYVEGEDADYLVLERLRGRTLKEAIADGFEPAERLRVAVEIARALAVTHARGVVHRDLKPSNVMLTDDGEVRVFDFGLAQALEGPEPVAAALPSAAETPPDGTLTRLGKIAGRHESDRSAGTPPYMSPEQARGERVTAASDLYAFGLLVQEIFTGRPAYPAGFGLGHLLKRAAGGGTLPIRGVDADVCKLVERLLSLSPEARPTAAEAVGELERIRDKPRRRRIRLALGTAVLLVLAAGVKYTVDLRRERNEAVAARAEAEQAHVEAEEVVRFLTELFEASHPRRSRGEETTARELLRRGTERIGEGIDEPVVKARLLRTLGTIQRELGAYDAARPLLEEALTIRERTFGGQHPEVADSLQELGTLYALQPAFGEPEPLYERALAIREQALGAGHPAVAETLHSLGTMAARHGRFDDAVAQLERAASIRKAALGADHPDLVRTLNNLVGVLMYQDRLQEAETLAREVLAIRERRFGERHPDTATSLEAVAILLRRQERHEEALRLVERALAAWESVLGAESPELGRTLGTLASIHLALGDTATAEAVYSRSLALMEGALGTDHPRLAYPLHSLAQILGQRGETAEAERLFRRALALHRKERPADHPDVAATRTAYAELLRAAGRDEEAAALEAER